MFAGVCLNECCRVLSPQQSSSTVKEGQARAEQLVRYETGCLCVFVCVLRMGPLLGETYRQEGEVKFTASSSRPVYTPHAITHTHTGTHTHRAHTLPALTIHLSTLFYSFYQEYCSHTFPALPSFLLCHAQSGKTGQPYLFPPKKSFIIIIIFQS